MGAKMKALSARKSARLTSLEAKYEHTVDKAAATFMGTDTQFAAWMVRLASTYCVLAQKITGAPMLLSVASVRGSIWCKFYFADEEQPKPTDFSHLLERTVV